MPFFTTPTSFRIANPFIDLSSYQTPDLIALPPNPPTYSILRKSGRHSSHPDFGHLLLLIFEAVLEVVCVSLPGYIVARQGMFNAEMQKFVANLNVMLFTPCLIFTKLASQLTAEKLTELAVIPIIFVLQTLVSYLCSIALSRLFGFGKRPRNFVVAMGVFGNSNSLPISLVISLSQTLKGLHWDKIPGDNDNEVGARGILYLLIFQQLGQLVRWSWGYHVLLAPPNTFVEADEHNGSQAEQGQGSYRDNPDEEEQSLLHSSESQFKTDDAAEATKLHDVDSHDNTGEGSQSSSGFESGGQTPVTRHEYTSSVSSEDGLLNSKTPKGLLPTPANGNVMPERGDDSHIISFPSIRPSRSQSGKDIPKGPRGWITHFKIFFQRIYSKVAWLLDTIGAKFSSALGVVFNSFPKPLQKALSTVASRLRRFMNGLWAFMNPPLWAMLAAIIVASIPSLQRLFFYEGSFVRNSVTRAIGQSGGVAVPLILVVLGANLARNTLPQEAQRESAEDKKMNRNLLIACLISRMLLPTIIMAPILALAAKYIPISILDDPIFVIVCFLLTGAPSALQLAQICQINGVYEAVMSKLLFQSYVIWILPSTLILVLCALEVVEWAKEL
ncbi:MAG: hypothetical protein M1836_003597 [Candelina mexicana]|nr:MAG: hypothetical protein M1836_003597 [Candelina mexicana]